MKEDESKQDESEEPRRKKIKHGHGHGYGSEHGHKHGHGHDHLRWRHGNGQSRNGKFGNGKVYGKGKLVRNRNKKNEVTEWRDVIFGGRTNYNDDVIEVNVTV
jgi:hypothetical protein